jgi:hypothetical protein
MEQTVLLRGLGGLAVTMEVVAVLPQLPGLKEKGL